MSASSFWLSAVNKQQVIGPHGNKKRRVPKTTSNTHPENRRGCERRIMSSLHIHFDDSSPAAAGGSRGGAGVNGFKWNI